MRIRVFCWVRWYSPYGQVQRQSGSVSPIIQYGQLPWDGNVGLGVSPTRLYDPGVGRWLSRDPIGEAGGINLYAYVGASPTMGIDPDGQNPAVAVVAACAANPVACAAVVVGGIGTARQFFFPPSNPVLVPIYPMAKPPRTKDVPGNPSNSDGKCENLGEGYKVPTKEMHGIKKRILDATGRNNFGKKVGTNPDIKVKNGEIVLTGARNGPFSGKSYPTDLNPTDFIP